MTAAQDHQDLEGTFAAGRPVAAPVILRPAKIPKPQPEFAAAEIRAWAIDMGHQVSDRGRIPAELVQAFRDRATTPAGGAVGPGAP